MRLRLAMLIVLFTGALQGCVTGAVLGAGAIAADAIAEEAQGGDGPF